MSLLRRQISPIPSFIIFFYFLFIALVWGQQASDHRAYATAIAQRNYIYIIGGSNETLTVPILNITGGIDSNNPEWLQFEQNTTSILKPFEKGVAYQATNEQVYVQGGSGTSLEMQNLMKYTPATNSWEQFYQTLAERPEPRYMMTANLDRSTNIAYYYGGQPLTVGASASADFTSFNTNTGEWKKLSPRYPFAVRPGRSAHTANLINKQLFILGGVTDDANATTDRVEADFRSVLVYDITSNTAAAIATLGDIPKVRQSFSTAVGLDGRSIVLFGGYIYTQSNEFQPAPNDIYILDTCTLTWRKQSVSGKAPGPLYAHSTININNYMVIFMGKTDATNYNERIYILDLKQWKWVDKFTDISTSTEAKDSCQFTLPANFNSSDVTFYPFNYDYSVLMNPFTPSSDSSKKAKGFGIGFGLFFLILVVGGIYLYLRRIRKKTRTFNPRWIRHIPETMAASEAPSADDSRGGTGKNSDYPLFVYNNLENGSINYQQPHHTATMYSPQHNIRTYTASDHEKWERELVKHDRDNNHRDAVTNDIWRRMEGLNSNNSR
ncbi:hypothetical protein BDF20DRAFT_871291 [Mycotypha africana]|uniref:uncharacterized protein n=1 Tax=Mycotypha africana TaxID=64632 RepID=UPI0023009B41|nr:uncharacterized protein BDF20DRAFT_871291 [Mycotypha africana]KAI8979726.1 hypothetical protein BDF20DRAFT_871291 [Mycotypha africana]